MVNWKEAGLGDNQQISYTASADWTLTIVCVIKDGGKPGASNNTPISHAVTATGTFNSDKNGSITASLTITPPPVVIDFQCPSGQTRATAEVKYENVKLVDTTNGIEALIPSTSDCQLPNVRGACD